jgi:signal transduction histidine kinase
MSLEDSVEFESRQRNKDGETIPVEVRLNLVMIGGRTFVQAFCRDITERRRLEEEKERIQAQLTQAQKLESIGRLAGGVAHDFNNMLNVIIGHADLVLEDAPENDPVRNDLEEILKAAHRSAGLTRQLLAFARRQTVVPKVLDLNSTIDSMLQMLRRLIGEGIALQWKPGASLDPIRIDPAQIDQLVANLVVNARDAISGIGTIIIQTEQVEVGEEYTVEHPDASAGKYVTLKVTDNGKGMDEETKSKIFEPFFTTKGVGEGTGLGLATVHGIVQQNNGFISVQSEIGQGSAFCIYLPVYESGRTAQTLPVSEPAALQSGGETILLVEDEPSILALGRMMLERLGYNVIAAESPGEAIRLASEFPGDIHLLITDVVMPEMNGRDLARRLLTLYPDIKRLFMSGYTADVIAHQGVLEEGIAFIQKPFTQREFTGKVREVLQM